MATFKENIWFFLSLQGKKPRHFDKFVLKKCLTGQKSKLFFCPQLCGEKIVPTLSPSVTSNFTPPLKPFFGGHFTFWGIIPPSGKKSLPICGHHDHPKKSTGLPNFSYVCLRYTCRSCTNLLQLHKNIPIYFLPTAQKLCHSGDVSLLWFSSL